jgi:hypothetical protein
VFNLFDCVPQSALSGLVDTGEVKAGTWGFCSSGVASLSANALGGLGIGSKVIGPSGCIAPRLGYDIPQSIFNALEEVPGIDVSGIDRAVIKKLTYALVLFPIGMPEVEVPRRLWKLTRLSNNSHWFRQSGPAFHFPGLGTAESNIGDHRLPTIMGYGAGRLTNQRLDSVDDRLAEKYAYMSLLVTGCVGKLRISTWPRPNSSLLSTITQAKNTMFLIDRFHRRDRRLLYRQEAD